MKHSASVFALVLAGATALPAQQAAPPIHAVSAPMAVTKEPLRWVDELREMAGGKVLINDTDGRRLLLFDASLTHATALSDTLNAGAPAYPNLARMIPYTADSTLFAESDSRSFVVIDPQGTLGRIIAAPRTQDFNYLMNIGPAGTDMHGSLVYQGRRPTGFPGICRPAGAEPPRAAPPPPISLGDSVAIIRGNWETRVVDTLGRSQVIGGANFLPTITTDAGCKILSAKLRIDPSLPTTDSWTVTSSGSVAIVRGHDYHVDFVDPDGTRRSGPKLPFDWRRLTDKDKQARVDSAKKLVDSVTARGGYRMRLCGGQMSFIIDPPAPGDTSFGGLSGGVAANGRAVGCQTVTVTAEFPKIEEMSDYVAPIREEAVQADRDGNVWILPTTTLSARGGLLYDVVNPKGELVERVQLPADRSIAGFGKDGVLYLSHKISPTRVAIERLKILR